MSNEAITWAYGQKLPAGEKFVLVALADMADEAHSCFPGQEKLAAMTGQGVRSIRRHLEHLEECGLIRREKRFAADGKRTSDRYTLPVGRTTTGQNDRRSKRPVANLTGGQKQQDNRPDSTDSSGQNGRVTQSTNPKKNPQINTPQPPASGGQRSHCKKHTKFRNGCNPCAAAEAARLAALTARQRARDGCTHCNGSGWAGDPDHPTKCDHRPIGVTA